MIEDFESYYKAASSQDARFDGWLRGEPLPDSLCGFGDDLTYLFPDAPAVAKADLEGLGMPTGRREALHGLAHALAVDKILIDSGAGREETESQLLSIKSIGPWTESYVAMRALGGPDAFLPTDLGVRRAVERLGGEGNPASIARLAERWRSWRAYATQYLWTRLEDSKKKGEAA